MKNSIKNIGVLTSGGDAPGMNAAVRAVVRAAVYNNIKCFAIYHGYKGLIENIMKEVDARSVKGTINKGGTILKSTRCLEFRTPEGRKKAFENIKKNNIDGLITIGGDGTFKGAIIFEKEYNIPIIGIPGTIDNDILGTDFTIGYDTALNTVIEAIDKIRDTANSHNRLFFVEVMGRDAGHIALNTGIGIGAVEILIPEEKSALERLLKTLDRNKKTGRTSNIVVVAEGDKTGKNVFEIAEYVEKNLPYYEVRVSVLGHMQRGGNPSCYDRVLASRMGVKAVEELLNGKTSVMTGIINNKIILTPLKKAIKKGTKINKKLIRVSNILAT